MNFRNTFNDTTKQIVTTHPVSYTHLDVYKRQTISCSMHLIAKHTYRAEINVSLVLYSFTIGN